MLFRLLLLLAGIVSTSTAAELLAGTARVDITDRTGPVHDPCFAKVLMLKSPESTIVIVTVDAVAIGEIGRIGNGFMAEVRGKLKESLGLKAESLIVNASHCHGIIRADTPMLVVQAVQEAAKALVPVKLGVGIGHEDRISENRRLKLKDGTEADMRRAYALPRDEDVASVGPIDPKIGLVRIDRADGSPLAVLYQFACHPIMNPPSKGCSADFPGFASKVIEEALGGGATAMFLQGCGGDINPIRYKAISTPANAEPLGTMLGARVLAAIRGIQTNAAPIKATRSTLSLPRAADYAQRIATNDAEVQKTLAALKPTNINFKAFLPLLLQHKLWPDYPSQHAQSYLHDQARSNPALQQLDADNRVQIDAYLHNIELMEKLTRLRTNAALLKRHAEQTKAAGDAKLDVEICALRLGEFKLITFPGELTVEVGLAIQAAAKDLNVFISGYTNGYIYYTPTREQRLNKGYAQEDCDTLVAPEWQQLFQTRALDLLKTLQE